MSNNNDYNNNDATRSCSEIFVMTFGFYCPPCSFEHPHSCPVCAVILSTIFINNLLLWLFHFILPCQGGHWVSKNVVGSEPHVPIGLRRQKQGLKGHSKEAINEIKAIKQMLKPDDYKDGDRISATSPQSTLQIESQQTGTPIWQNHESSPHSQRQKKKKSPHATWPPYICDCVVEISVVCIWKRKL